MGGRHGKSGGVCLFRVTLCGLCKSPLRVNVEMDQSRVDLFQLCFSPSSRQTARSGAQLDDMAAKEHLVQQVNQLILRPELHDVLAILKGARNGFVYGVSEWLPIHPIRCWQLPASATDMATVLQRTAC